MIMRSRGNQKEECVSNASENSRISCSTTVRLPEGSGCCPHLASLLKEGDQARIFTPDWLVVLPKYLVAMPEYRREFGVHGRPKLSH